MTDRPALKPDEIEITPEMIEAGAEVLQLSELGDSSEGTVKKIYLAMHSALLKSGT